MNAPAPTSLHLVGITFADLFCVEGLARLDRLFLEQLERHDSGLHTQLLGYRKADRPFTALEISALLLACAPHLEDFIAALFGIERELEVSQARTVAHNVVLHFKKLIVQRRARRGQDRDAGTGRE